MRVYGADKVWRQLHREEQAVARCTVERLMRHIKKAAMKCPVCGAAELIHDTRDVPYTYKGETTVIAAVTGEFCPACAESILDASESSRVMREMRDFLSRSI